MSQSMTIGQSRKKAKPATGEADSKALEVTRNEMAGNDPSVSCNVITPRKRNTSGLKPIQKGEVRNPNGINGFTGAKAAMRDRATMLMEKAMRVLEKNLDSDDERVAQTAAQTLLDRAFGKSVQPTAETDSEGNDRPPPPPMVVIGVKA